MKLKLQFQGLKTCNDCVHIILLGKKNYSYAKGLLLLLYAKLLGRRMNIKFKVFTRKKLFDMMDQNKEEKLRIITQIKVKVLQEI